MVFIIYALFSLLNAYARASARLFMTQHALLPRDMLSTICYNQESDERAALGELRATKWSPDKTLRSRTAHKRITHGGCTWKDDEYRCTYPIKPLSPAAGYLRSEGRFVEHSLQSFGFSAFGILDLKIPKQFGILDLKIPKQFGIFRYNIPKLFGFFEDSVLVFRRPGLRDVPDEKSGSFW